MARTSVEVVRNDFPKIARALPQIAYEAVSETVVAIEGQYRATVHVDLGQLVNSIESEAEPTAEGAEGAVGATAEHAPYEEFGTGARGSGSNFPGKPQVPYTAGWIGREAHPALTPAVLENEGTLARAIASRMGRYRG
jgi:hypothetical protein